MARLTLENVTVRLPVVTNVSQRSLFSAAARTATFGRMGRASNGVGFVEPLTDISIDLKDGDRLALIGHNGAGKSTLLRTMASIVLPQSGRAFRDGDVSLLFNLGTALETEQTGRQNLDFYARYLGLSKSERLDMIEDVAEFSELGVFIDMPVRTYSSGMLVRMLFGAATASPRDILLVDEVISAGDAQFFQKAKRRAWDSFSRGRISVMASHAPEVIFDLCNKAIRLERGRIVDEGDPRAVWDRYYREKTVQPEAAAPAAESDAPASASLPAEG